MNKATRINKSGNPAASLISGKTIRQFILFAAVGAVGTGGQYISLVILVEAGLLAKVPASIVGFTVGAIINYFLNYRFTFNSDKSHREAISKFFIVAIIGAAINTVLFYTGIRFFHMYYLLAQLVATVIVLIWNFLANKLWTFRQAP